MPSRSKYDAELPGEGLLVYHVDDSIEGNAADVQTFVGPDGHILAIISEEDIDPAVTEFQIELPAVAAHTSRGCAMLGDFTKVYNRPAQELSADVAYIGRGCPASPCRKACRQPPNSARSLQPTPFS